MTGMTDRTSYRLATGIAFALAAVWSFSPVTATAQKFTMKFATATVNDTQHEATSRCTRRRSRRHLTGVSMSASTRAAELGRPRMIDGLQLGTVEAYIGPGRLLCRCRPALRRVLDPDAVQNDAQATAAVQDPSIERVHPRHGCGKGPSRATAPMPQARRTTPARHRS